MFDLVLEGGDVAVPGGPLRLDLAILDGKIAAVGLPGTLGARAETMQLDGLLLVPGGVEPHVHAGHPLVSPLDGSAFLGGGPTELSTAAIYGGTTTLVDFARIPTGGQIWPVVEEQMAVWSGQSFCDFSFHVWFHGDVTDDQLAEVPDVVARGFPSFKVFTTDGLPSRRGRKVNMGSLLELMGTVAEHGGIIAVHGEDDDLVMHTYEKLVREGNTSYHNMPVVHSALSEELAFRTVIRLAAETPGAAVYFMHVSAAAGVQAIAEARARHLPIYGETLPLYALQNADAYLASDGMKFHTYPSLKTKTDQEAIWRALAAGDLATFATDEISTSYAEKVAGDRIDTVVGGHVGLEPRMALLYTEIVERRGLGVGRFVQLTSTNAARIFGLYPAKGLIAVGSDADLVALRKGERTISAGDLHETDYSPWEGWDVTVWPEITIRRGEVMVDATGLRGDPTGRLVERRLEPDILQRNAV